jgi:hypothetical protein
MVRFGSVMLYSTAYLVLTYSTTDPEPSLVLTKWFETAEFCETAAGNVTTPGAIVGCLPQIPSGGASRPARPSPDLRNGALTPPTAD